MRLAKFIGAASVAALLTFYSTATLAETTDLVTVTVVGSGANEAEARLDAIRQATQQVASQVVVAERRIVDDEVVYDNVMSTMNGFVHDFTDLGVTKSGTEVQIKAEVVVSGSLMRDFASGQASSVTVDGGGMFGELLRSKSQAEVHQKMFESIWKRYGDGLQAELTLKDFNEEYVSFDLTLRWRQEFVNSIKDLLYDYSYASCSVNYDIHHVSYLADLVSRGGCQIKDGSVDQAIEKLKKASDDRRNSARPIGNSFGRFEFNASCFQEGRELLSCLIFDSVSVFPLFESKMEYFNENFEELSRPDKVVKVFGYYDKYGRSSSLDLSSGQPQNIRRGVAPFSVQLDISLKNSNKAGLVSFRVSLPIDSLFGSDSNGTAPWGMWGEILTLRDTSFRIDIPTEIIPLKDVSIAEARIYTEN